MIPYGRQDITAEDIDAVVEVLRSDFLTQGPAVPRFEEAIAGYCGRDMRSPSTARHRRCTSPAWRWIWVLAIGSGPSPNTFVASANCGLYCGAQVDFVDIDPRTYNLCADALEKKLEQAKADGRLPRVVIPVHMTGQSCDMRRIGALASAMASGWSRMRPMRSAPAIGRAGRQLPLQRYLRVQLSPGQDHYDRRRRHGDDQRPGAGTTHGAAAQPRHHPRPGGDDPCPGRAVVLPADRAGLNYRLTDLQAALGLSQLERLDDYVVRRHELARRYDELLSDLPLCTPWQHPDSYSAFHLYVIQLELDRIIGHIARFSRSCESRVSE